MRFRISRLRLLLLGIVLLGAGGWLVWQHWLPRWHGTVVITGLQQPVEILRDAYAIPHIYAQTETDAYMALGYVHAQDRLWQMEVQRRLGAGTLAEVLGADAVELDRFSRIMGIRHSAVANLPHLDTRTQQILAAYTGGINAYLAEGRLLPLEFLVLRCTPALWTPEDSLGWLKMMAWDLSGNWWQELRNVRLQQRLSPQQMQDLLPPYPGEAPQVLPDLATLYTGLNVPTTVLWGHLPAVAQGAVGSNNWAVDGTRTHSGKPLLANDPHLRLTAPALWYLAHLQTPEMQVIGATLPGIPAVILGRNERVAWAFTNTGSDTQDLFVEKIAAHDPERYLTPEGWRTFETAQEIIKVQGQADIALTVRRSRHGPVISDTARTANLPRQSVLALSWVALRPDDLSLQFPLKAATARNGAELLQAARDFHSPQQNIVYADVDGQIGFVAAGRVPLRSAANDAKGLVPVPGWKTEYDWQGWIPFAELPQTTDTATGTLVTANQKITPPGYRHWLTSGWEGPYRAERIQVLLDTTPHHSIASFTAIQRDVYNPVAATLLPLMLRIHPQSAIEQAALKRLQQWDMVMTRESPEALLFVEWLRHLGPLLAKPTLGQLYDEMGDYQPAFLASVLRQGKTPWCGEAVTEPPCAAELRRALGLALERLTQRYGAELSRWAWGKAHLAVAAHQPFGEVPLLSWLFNIRTAKAGAYDTIDVSSYLYDEASAMYHSRFGPNYRAIYDLAMPENSRFLSNTGQSGHLLSRHYRSMVRAWQEGHSIPMHTDYTRVARQAAGRLLLQPH